MTVTPVRVSDSGSTWIGAAARPPWSLPSDHHRLVGVAKFTLPITRLASWNALGLISGSNPTAGAATAAASAAARRRARGRASRTQGAASSAHGLLATASPRSTAALRQRF